MKVEGLKAGLFFALLAAGSLFAAVQQVAIDENGEIQPAEARLAISNAVSAVVRVNLAEATAENILVIAETTTNALDVLEQALAHRTDYSLVQLVATGLEDATGDISTDGGSIQFIEDREWGYRINVDQSDATNVYVTLYYLFTGNLTTPRIRAKSQLSGEWLEDVAQTAPEAISIGGGTNIYRTVVTVPRSWGATSNAFFQVTADIKTAVDDGKVFDIYSDTGVTGTFTVTPASTVTFRIVAGRVVSMSGSGIIVGE